MRAQKRKQVATDTSAPTDTIPYDKAVREGKEIILEIESAERGQLRLGELAHKLEKKYGDRTLAKFAAEIGVAKCTLDRYQTVYRAWEGKLAPGPISISYAVLRELATHPAREQIISKNLNLTKREALDMMRELKGAAKEKQKQEQEDDWLKHNRRWFRELYAHAEEAYRAADVALNCPPEKQRELLRVVEPLMRDNLRMYGGMLRTFADHYEKLLAEQEAAERATTSAARRREQCRGHRVQVTPVVRRPGRFPRVRSARRCPHPLALLRIRRERPRHRGCAAEQCDELAPLHSITSSARMEVEAMFVLRRPGQSDSPLSVALVEGR
jgi:DNA repair exonuclease SbcCD ATPase subunit